MESKQYAFVDNIEENLIITTGDIVGEYQSMRVAEKVTGVAHEHISACCRNKQRTAGGYKWQYI